MISLTSKIKRFLLLSLCSSVISTPRQYWCERLGFSVFRRLYILIDGSTFGLVSFNGIWWYSLAMWGGGGVMLVGNLMWCYGVEDPNNSSATSTASIKMIFWILCSGWLEENPFWIFNTEDVVDEMVIFTLIEIDSSLLSLQRTLSPPHSLNLRNFGANLEFSE